MKILPPKAYLFCRLFWGLSVLLLDIEMVLANPLPDTIVIGSDFIKAEIGSKCQLRTANDFVRYTPSDSNWKTASSNNNISLTADKVHWIFGILKNVSQTDEGMKLYLNHVQSGPIRLYVLVDGKVITSEITGSILPLKQRATTDRMLSFPLIIPAGKTAEFYIQAQRKEIGMTISPLLSKPLSDKSLPWADTALWVSLSFISIIFFTAILVLIYTPAKSVVYFLFYILFGLLYVMAASGYGSLYLWSSIPWFEENAAAFLAAISICGLFGFSKSILPLEKDYKRINFALKVFMVIYPAVTLAGFALYFDKLKPGLYAVLMNVMYLFLFFFFLSILFISLYEAVKKKQKEYYWFVAIFSLFAFLSVVTILFETGLWEYNYKMHTVLLIASSVPQMSIMLLFLINKLVVMLKKRTLEVEDVRVQSEKYLLNRQLQISRELHDEVGATLSGVAMYSHLTKSQLQSRDLTGVENSLTIMQDSSAQMVNKLNDIVWLINPDKSSLPDLMQRLEEYARNMAAVKNMEVKINIAETVHQHQLTIEQRRNIYLFCKEAINNAAKYSEGTLLVLSVKADENVLGFSVRDNGKGFDPETVKPGNGAGNLKQRADEIDAEYMLHVSEGNGCEVSLYLTITR